MTRQIASREARGYGIAHRAERARWIPRVQAGDITCARQGPKCTGQPIAPDQPWDLGHTDDRTSWTGPECIPCNRGAGAINATKARVEKQQTTIREW